MPTNRRSEAVRGQGRDQSVSRSAVGARAAAGKVVTVTRIAVAAAEVITDMFGWERYQITFEDFNLAAASGSKLVANMPPRSILRGVVIEPIEPFDGGALSAYTLSVGSTGEAERYAGAFDVAAAIDDTAEYTSGIDVLESLVSVAGIYVHAACAGGNLEDATQGSAFIWIQRETLE